MLFCLKSVIGSAIKGVEIMEAALSSSRGALTSTSSYFIPNYPSNSEAVFYIPRMPDIAPTLEPHPPRRPPPPGYDVKTLRRQVEYLQEEINDRVKNYNSICHQNEQLWAYVQELLEANKFNASISKEQIHKLNEQLREVHKERYLLAEKLFFARDSKQLIQNLSRDLEEDQVGAEEMAKRRKEAEAALQTAAEERKQMEDDLLEKMQKIKGYEDLLDCYRLQGRELQSLETADHFFHSNKTVLKAAYHRFKQGVKRRLRLCKIQTVLADIYKSYLKRCHWRLWMAHVYRSGIMKRNQARRRRELLILSFTRMKVFAALGKLFKRSRRKHLFRLLVGTLKVNVEIARREQKVQLRIGAWKNKELLRRIVVAWKQETLFVGWNRPEILQQEAVATSFFRRKLFVLWRDVVREERSLLQEKQAWIQRKTVLWRFQEWRLTCLRLWRYRGRLVRRFVRNSRQRLSIRAYYDGLDRRARMFHWQFCKRNLFRRWIHFAQSRRQFIILPPSVPSVTVAVPDALAEDLTNALSQPPSAASSVTGASINHQHIHHHQHIALPFPPTPARQHHIHHHQLPQEVRNGHREGQVRRLLGHMQRRTLQTVFPVFTCNLLQLRQQRVNDNLATQHQRDRPRRLALRILHKAAQHRRRRRLLSTALTLSRALRIWRRYQHELRHKQRFLEGYRALQVHQQLSRLRQRWSQWQDAQRRQRRLQRCAAVVHDLHNHALLRRYYRTLASRYLSLTLWKLRTLQIDLHKAHAVRQVQEESLVTLQNEQVALTQTAESLEVALENSRAELQAKESAIQHQLQLTSEQESLRVRLEHEVEDLQRQVTEAQAERARWQALEAQLQAERAQEAEIRQRKQADAAQRIAQLQEESEQLQHSMQDAQARATQARLAAEIALQKQIQEYQTAEEALQETKQVVQEESQAIVALENEQEALMLALEQVQRKAKDVVQDGVHLKADNERTLRQRLAEVQVLTADVGE